ncbi:MAG: prepilin-type N-terminal cleavage/methylation domain-containing protein [bacterium]|nr:prepilin-type N-terminal cleavage/methylation domain-containing protein [bacterium]
MGLKKGFNSRGFTLIELLIVIAILAILAAVAFVALDPLTRFRDARDSTRFSDITAILGAIKIHQVDSGGPYAYEISHNASTATGTPFMITGSQNATSTSGCNLSCDVTIASGNCIGLGQLATLGYLGKIPTSTNGTVNWSSESDSTGYYLVLNSNNSVTVGACESENTTEIKITR